MRMFTHANHHVASVTVMLHGDTADRRDVAARATRETVAGSYGRARIGFGGAVLMASGFGVGANSCQWPP